jgi:hypothetical protein
MSNVWYICAHQKGANYLDDDDDHNDWVVAHQDDDGDDQMKPYM